MLLYPFYVFDEIHFRIISDAKCQTFVTNWNKFRVYKINFC